MARIVNSASYRAFHPLYVTYSPGFIVKNPVRDVVRTYKTLGPMYEVSLAELVTRQMKAVPSAYRRFIGIDDPVILEMQDAGAIDIPFQSADAMEQRDSSTRADLKLGGQGTRSTVYGDQLRRAGLIEPDKIRAEAIPVIGFFLQILRGGGEITETATKIAGWEAMKARGVPVPARAYDTRKYVGTPDYKQSGLATVLTNGVWMYSRVKWNGLTADANVATHPDTAAGYWWRTMKTTIAPTSWSKLAAYGVLGRTLAAMIGLDGDEGDEDDDDREYGWLEDELGKAAKKKPTTAGGSILNWLNSYDRLGRYYSTDYTSIPVGVDPDGRVDFISIPSDDTGKLVANMWWDATDLMQLGMGSEVKAGRRSGDVIGSMFGTVEEAFIPQFAPPLSMAGNWGMYAAGNNPVNGFTNRPIVGSEDFKIGGWASHSDMIGYTLDQFGPAGQALNYGLSPLMGESYETGAETWGEATKNVLGTVTGINSLIRKTDRGLSDEKWARRRADDRDDAIFNKQIPRAARDISSQYYQFQAEEARNQGILSAKDRTKYAYSELFYKGVYLPLREEIRKGDRPLEEIQADLKRAAKIYDTTLTTDPPESVKPTVARALQLTVLSAVEPPPVEENYTNKDTFDKKKLAWEKTEKMRIREMLTLVPTIEEAKELLITGAKRDRVGVSRGTIKLGKTYSKGIKVIEKVYGIKKSKGAK